MKKNFIGLILIMTISIMTNGLKAQSITGFAKKELGCDYSTWTWRESGTDATLKREWSGCLSTFKATWNVKKGNHITNVGRWLGDKDEWVQMNKVQANYTLKWSGSGSISGGNYYFGPYFGIKAKPTDTKWIECYVVHKSGHPQSRWDKSPFTYLGSANGYKFYKRWANWGVGFWQLWAVKQTYSWNGPCNIRMILDQWISKSGLFNNNWYCKSFALIVETKTDDGWFKASNINFPKATNCPASTIKPYVLVDNGSWQQNTNITVASGKRVRFGPHPISGGSWKWSGCGISGSNATKRDPNIYPTSSCNITATHTNSCGAKSSVTYKITVSGGSSSGGATEFKYDLGTPSSPLQSGYKRVSQNTRMGSFGWTSWNGLGSRDRGASSQRNNLNRDIVFSDKPCNFRQNVSNGSWNVLITFGDVGYRDKMNVKAEGQTKLSNISSNPNQYFNRSFNVNVNDGKLDLEFSDGGGSNPHWSITRIWLKKNKSAVETVTHEEFSCLLYPNPAQNELHMNFIGEIQENAHLAVYNSIGQLVLSDQIFEINQILSLNSLDKGMYILQVINGDTIINEQFIKE